MKSVMDVYGDIALPVWTKEEEVESYKIWKKNRSAWVDLAMRHNLNMVFSYVNKHCYAADKEDVFQEALVQLVQALRTFDPKKGHRVSTWISRKVLWGVYQAQDAANHKGSISEELRFMNQEAKKNGKASAGCVVSVDAKMGGDEDADTIGSTISSKSVAPDYAISRGMEDTDAAKDVEESEIQDGVAILVQKMSKILNGQEIKVIRYFLKGMNQSQISVKMNVSRMRISQVTASAFAKIRSSEIAPMLKGMVA